MDVDNRGPGESWSLARDLRSSGAFPDAETVLEGALRVYPADRPLLTEYALCAQARSDWPEAYRRWSSLRAEAPADWIGYGGQAAALAAQQRWDEVIALFANTQAGFADDPKRLYDLAWLTQQYPESDAAIAFRDLLANERTDWTFSVSVANALRQANRFDEAEAVLEAALASSSPHAVLFEDYARLAEARGDWSAALRRWQTAQTHFPDRAVGFVGAAKALARLDKPQEAFEGLRDAVRRFPADAEALHDLGRAAERRGDWAVAEHSWRGFVELGGRHWWAHMALATAVLRQGRPGEARRVLSDIIVTHPGQTALHAELARVHQVEGNLAAALREWKIVTTQMRGITDHVPHVPSADFIVALMARIRDHAARERAFKARFSGRTSSRLICNTGQGLFPFIESITGLSTDKFAICFESLGYNCELGFIQRACDAEPLSLTKFSGITIASMTVGLRENFNRLPFADNLIAEKPGPDWDIRDKTYNLAYHTFLPVASISEDAMLAQQGRRLRFLIEKYIRDLADGSKIFVVWRDEAPLRREEIEELRAAIALHGQPPVLWLVHADKEPIGLVQQIEPNLMKGYIQYVPPPDHGPDLNCWLPVLINAYRLYHATRK